MDNIRQKTDKTHVFDPSIKEILPHEKMYNVQIGNERFVLSGASLSSDAPSYFTNYFSNSANNDKILFIDRSPTVFKLIYAHLQGYYLEIDDADVFTKLFNDALYYNLPKLRDSLKNNEYYYVLIEGKSLKFSKNLISGPGNFPNFFTVANDALYEDISNLIVDKKWIRPPPQAAPSLNRCSVLLIELIKIFQGVEIEIRSEEHRKSLIREAKYYRFGSLVEKLIKHKIIYNPFWEKEEILITLEYLDQKSLDLSRDYWSYKRFYVDEFERILQIQFEYPDVEINQDDNNYIIFKFHSKSNHKLQSLLTKFSASREMTFANVAFIQNKTLIKIPLSQFKSFNSSIKLNSKQLDSLKTVESINWKLLKSLLRFKFLKHQEKHFILPELVKAEAVETIGDFYNELQFI
ncbi:hypothetical protein WICMUC_002509 [Wickerhamomyces mucosus]|uniref:BTB domain-containing protein n=1 Tax=Wickerhamomyces mucosus TaxID=1378264 RepID=A0A9P8PQD9_9ASCO|nr:hypothetical protein WICMUC_002509 [Wickerhamomyces mucosus]